MTERTSLVTCIRCQNHERLEHNVQKYVCPKCTAKNIRRFQENRRLEEIKRESDASDNA